MIFSNTMLQTTTTTTTTTEAPVTIRQRVRGRLGGRTTDSAIQTRPRGSQDEYVRFSAVNQDRSNGRQRARPRTRAQPSGNSPIQTDGQEYVRIQSSGARRQPAATSTTARTTVEEQPKEDEEDYGFIRQPNYRPAQQTNYKTTQQTQVGILYIYTCNFLIRVHSHKRDVFFEVY